MCRNVNVGRDYKPFLVSIVFGWRNKTMRQFV